MSLINPDCELVVLLYEDLPRWIDHLLMHFKAEDVLSQSGADSDAAPIWPATEASLTSPLEAQTIRQLLNYAKRKLQTSRMPHFLRVTMYLRVCCLAIQHNLLSEQQIALGSLYHTLLHWLWECEPDWWEHCTITDNRGITSSNARVQDLLKPLQDFVSQFAEA
ncbi:MAG: hypothetical protein EDM05_020400 [Leptolyngbya sp. IPPAS B-1204]|uniref:Uncharacterized protein n=1 Tax=Leptolyngbya sp. NK1-12 TaxID=2547451 RepID=A0AA96WCC2_9CYAN|nr:hypothetical protein [Leptolyngbya sp. NK1-12]MBF2050620.1 hypothetical protein [Elainella sp. C42_A2020_010]RNJ64920.1 MAG: hypothetical protein EDM05_33990 [Leptolyngbya sp. IPPAS B-1204]WNZ22468.1 hypothetical protein HJG54_06055 [Leptolyngbya sp. NK1-12]